MPKTLPISRKLRRSLEELALQLYFLPKPSAKRGQKHPYLESVSHTRPGVLAGIRDEAERAAALITRQLGDRPSPPPVWQLVSPDDPRADAQKENGDPARGRSRGSPVNFRPRPRTRRRP